MFRRFDVILVVRSRKTISRCRSIYFDCDAGEMITFPQQFHFTLQHKCANSRQSSAHPRSVRLSSSGINGCKVSYFKSNLKSFFDEFLSTVAVKPDFVSSAYFNGIGDFSGLTPPANPGISGTISESCLNATLYFPGMAPSLGSIVCSTNLPFSSDVPCAIIPSLSSGTNITLILPIGFSL